MENLEQTQKRIMQKLSCLERDIYFLETTKEEICLFDYEEIGEIKEKLQNAISDIENIIDEIDSI